MDAVAREQQRAGDCAWGFAAQKAGLALGRALLARGGQPVLLVVAATATAAALAVSLRLPRFSREPARDNPRSAG